MKFASRGHVFEGLGEDAVCERCGRTRDVTSRSLTYCPNMPLPINERKAGEPSLERTRQDHGPLQTASKLVYKDRRNDYGTPEANHGRTAQLWSTYLGIEVTARDVCMLNILQKVSRDRFKPLGDNLVDIAGYAENAHLCAFPVRAIDEPSKTE